MKGSRVLFFEKKPIGLNTGKYGPEKTPYLDTVHAVYMTLKWLNSQERT